MQKQKDDEEALEKLVDNAPCINVININKEF